MLGNFGAGGKQERGWELCADFSNETLPALNFHLQCYRLRCLLVLPDKKLQRTSGDSRPVLESRRRANREVQTVAEKGLSREVSRAAGKRRINRELEAKKAHKP